MVEDADLTNSPISLSLARTTLLSTPNSFASSWTRTFATLLLLVRAGGRTVSWCACSSGSTHRVLMSCCSNFFSVAVGWCCTGGRPFLLGQLSHMLLQPSAAEPGLRPEG